MNMIESRTIDGKVFLSAVDVVRILRGRSAEVKELAAALGNDLTPDEWERAVAWHTAAGELDQRADHIDLAVIEHVSS